MLCVPFLQLRVSNSRWLLFLHLPEMRKNKIKANTLGAVTQDQLVCNLTDRCVSFTGSSGCSVTSPEDYGMLYVDELSSSLSMLATTQWNSSR